MQTKKEFVKRIILMVFGYNKIKPSNKFMSLKWKKEKLNKCWKNNYIMNEKDNFT